MSSLLCGTLHITIVFVFVCIPMRDQFFMAVLRHRKMEVPLWCVFVYKVLEHFECSVLVVWREGHTRSHSEHGSQAS